MDNLRHHSHLIPVNRLHICDKTKLSCSFPVLKAQIWREKERAGSETNDKNEGSSRGTGAHRVCVPIRLNKQL